MTQTKFSSTSAPKSADKEAPEQKANVPEQKEKGQFRCAACGRFETLADAHPIMVRQENVPIHRQNTRFIRTTEVRICSKCLHRYGRIA
jgi:hypothetical protein